MTFWPPDRPRIVLCCASHQQTSHTQAERAHGDKLGLEAKVGHVGLDLLADERAEETEALRLLGVEGL